MIRKILLSSIVAMSLVATAWGAQEAVKFVGSKNSKKYHYSWCKAAQKISPKNLVEYKSAADAESAGKTPCKICKPSLTP